MSKIRGIIKLTLLLIFTLSTYAIYAVGLAILRIFRRRYEPWRNLFMRTWSQGTALIFNMDVKIQGSPPAAPFFLVSNHLSYLDIIPLYLSLRCTFVAKKAVRNWPVLGFMVHSVGVIFVDRKRKTDVKRVNKKLSEFMNEYQGVVFFPEATSSGGEGILPFHASLLQFPAKQKVPVHTASISYRTGPGDQHARDSVCFFGARDGFLEHLMKLAQTTQIDCKIKFGERTEQSSDRKELALKLRDNIQEYFEPTSKLEDQEA
ncbi:MAG: 1-acyl-sn-glycerol-3-phosphate acyltransferase [Gracilimonas sp.]|uniref:lysophospholipid acyltransferase family protein n=1 Tax=Gracilimonas sp. TaxID=1974203 RepID=UPI003752BAAD|nr:1-acyl-sn-glycerol-3-phosphate acyltransferase [Gracilimonas sp.]